MLTDSPYACWLSSGPALHNSTLPRSYCSIELPPGNETLREEFRSRSFGSFLKRWVNPGLIFVYFRSFQTNNTTFTTYKCETCPSSIWRQDLNPRPLEHVSSPITTRPGLPPCSFGFFIFIFRFTFQQKKIFLYLALAHSGPHLNIRSTLFSSHEAGASFFLLNKLLTK